jgi:geranylgeranyl diphosphate synthase type II
MSKAAIANGDTGVLHLKAVPSDEGERRRMRAEAVRAAAGLDRGRAPRREELETAGRGLLERLGLSARYLGFAMVAVSNEFWRGPFAAVPFSRRLLLLPHCLRHVTDCKGHYDARGLHCAGCGACALGGLKAEAEALGYRVLIAEGTPAVVDTLSFGSCGALLGMACLESLERAFPRVSALGVPNVAMPLLTNGCVTTTPEVEVLRDWLHLLDAAAAPGPGGCLAALRQAERLFERDELDVLLEGLVSKPDPGPAGQTEAIALEWLCEGGKRFRPFITLAGYAAASGGQGAPAGVRRIALAIEVFHKASLIHDDIADDDAYRYGRRTLHRRYGVGAALNVGDYLVGLGYGLVAASAGELGAGAVADILADLAEAHTRLCRGQGEELLWSRGDLLAVRPEDVQRIYALKTAPAFEAALCAGVRAARESTVGPADRELLRRYCRLVGVAYQLQNDLNDWEGDRRNKKLAGQDGIAHRPTMLLAFALEAGDATPLRELAAAGPHAPAREERLERLRALYAERGAFEKGRRLVEEYRRRARAEADAAAPERLRDLLHFILEAVL